ncbi:hypothetical protein TEA_020391 [Camellia sinensis var. sinensis]|uniref:Uncharacterized protein n=1 Tax=Camellia sinensis var. sinensis TaxID=542762 RepID=A0A4S4DQY3_CAMSN|nr:hypothetical protein TEA_020391 [Camellia sinensis var. sinensis]
MDFIPYCIIFAILLSAIGSADASIHAYHGDAFREVGSAYLLSAIHAYHGDAFREVGSAYLLSGGSEGIVASRSATPLAGNAIHDGQSYIRSAAALRRSIEFRKFISAAARLNFVNFVYLLRNLEKRRKKMKILNTEVNSFDSEISELTVN